MLSATARCLCKKVKITATEISSKFSVCHCETCTTWGGSALFATKCGANVQLEGGEKITIYHSSPWAERGFCSNCGTHLFCRLKKTGVYSLPVGLFKKLKGMEMEIQYFSDQRPDYYSFARKTREMTKVEVMNYFGKEK